MIADLAIAEMRKEIEHFCGLGARVIGQSRRRVLNDEQVPTAEKIYSIFDADQSRGPASSAGLSPRQLA